MSYVAFVLLGILSGVQGLAVKCGNGWTGYSESTNCYKFVHTSEKFEDAKLQCQDLGATLTIIKSHKERDLIGITLSQSTHADDSWWLGFSYFNDTDTTSGWKWSDGSDIDESITPWESGYPGEAHGCGSVNKLAKLVTNECEGEKPFVCQRPIGKAPACTEGWDHHGKSCYKHYHRDTTSFYEAQQICQSHGSDLIIVNNFAENRYIHSIIEPDQKDIWLGIKEVLSESKFEWVDGTADGGDGVIKNWDDNQPIFNDGQNAGYMSFLNNQKWSSRLMYERIGFVCEKTAGEECLFDSVGFQDRCYVFNTEINRPSSSYYWAGNERICQDLTMEMVAVETEEENTFLFDYTASLGKTKFWLGYIETDYKSKILMRVTDNKTTEDPDLYMRLLPDPVWEDYYRDAPILNGCEDCNNSWLIQGTDGILTYPMCEYTRGKTIDIGQFIHPKVTCPDGWEELGGFCYKDVRETRSWADAQANCQAIQKGANLVSIHSEYENEFVMKMIGDSVSWFGYTDRSEEGVWKWVDNTVSNYSSWYPGEPNGKRNENCGEIRFRAWNDQSCQAEFVSHYICKVKGEESGGPIIPETSTSPSSENCGNGGWIEDPVTGMCYNFLEDRLMFEDARGECRIRAGENQGGDLVSINSVHEQSIIMAFLSGSGRSDSFWIGLTDDTSSGAYEWTDGSPVSFVNWDDGEPSRGSEQHVEILASKGGVWNDVVSDALRIPLCEKKGKNYIDPPPPSDPPVACAQDWDLLFGKCFYFSENFDKLTTNWTEANEICKSLYPGATLASLRSYEESQEILKRTTTDQILLGGTDVEEESKWVWVEDGLPISPFTNWDHDQPNGGQRENCMEMYRQSHGYWHDINCEEGAPLKGFVCSYQNTICPRGWTLADGKCWFVGENKESWNAAKDYCNEKSGAKSSLATIHSDLSNEFVRNLSDSETQWIGLSNSSDKFQWVNGEPFDFDGWAENEPDLPDTEKCVMAEKDGWHTHDCAENSQFVCNMKATHYFTCPPGWSMYDRYCYLLVDNQLSWSNAQKHCNERQGNLASILSEAEQSYIKSLAHVSETKQNKWIGLNDLNEPQTFEWVDGSDMIYSAWEKELPDKHPDNNKNCNFMSKETDRWNHEDCSVSLSSVCKTSQMISAIPPDLYGCKAGQLIYEASCYDVSLVFFNLESAEKDCTGKNGHLVTINNEYEQALLTAYLGQYPGTFRIGIRFDKETMTFKWLNGEELTFTNWGKNEPKTDLDDQGAGLCAIVNPSGFWFVDVCSTQREYICELHREGYTTPPPPTTTTPEPLAQCFVGWSKYSNSCYRRFDQEVVSYAEARKYCQSYGADLAVIHDKNEQDFIQTTIYYQDTVWIGLEAHIGGGYEWVDGSAVDYVDWEDGSPDTHGDVDLCVLLRGGGGMLNSHCGHISYVLCEIEAGFEPPTTEVPPTPPPIRNCQEDEDGWIMRPDDDEYCYTFSTEEITWHNAEVSCKSLGGSLASIHSPEENSFITANFRKLYMSESWIGLNDLDEENIFQWVDGSAAQFFNWAKNEPSNYQGLEGCGTLYPGSIEQHFGKWNDANCGLKKNGYACKKFKNGESTTPKPTDPPKGHCPPDYSELNGKCYILQGLLMPLNWSAAREECQKMGNKLVSIHSFKENAFITSLIANAQNQSNYWIGLGMIPYYPFTEMWVDQSEVDFTHWGSGEPGSFYGDVVSGNIRGDGEGLSTWRADPEWTTLPYVCSTKTSEEHPEPPSRKKCDDTDHGDFVSFLDECYLVIDTPKSWEEAEQECGAKKAHLVSIQDKASQLYLMNEIPMTEAWIGLSNKKDHSRFDWVDGWPLKFANWADGFPATTEEDSCVIYNTTDGKWSQKSCNEPLGFVCKFSSAPLPTESPHGKCPDDYDDFGTPEYCYKLKTKMTSNFDDSLTSCFYDGGDLASIHDEALNNVLHAEVKKLNEKFWIGLFYRENEIQGSAYSWVDGSPNDGFFLWDDSQPSDSENQKCVFMNKENGKWISTNCNPFDVNGHICQKSRVVSSSTTSPTHPTDESTSTSTATTHTETTSSTHSTHPHTTEPTTHHSTTEATTTTKMTAVPNLGMSPGAKAAIVIMILLAAIMAVGLFFVWKSRQDRLRKLIGLGMTPMNGTSSTGFENVAFNAATANVSTNAENQKY